MCWCISLDIILLPPEPGLAPVPALLERFGVLVYFPGITLLAPEPGLAPEPALLASNGPDRIPCGIPPGNRLLQMSQSSSQKRLAEPLPDSYSTCPHVHYKLSTITDPPLSVRSLDVLLWS